MYNHILYCERLNNNKIDLLLVIKHACNMLRLIVKVNEMVHSSNLLIL